MKDSALNINYPFPEALIHQKSLKNDTSFGCRVLQPPFSSENEPHRFPSLGGTLTMTKAGGSS